jgi:hypothetical protein
LYITAKQVIAQVAELSGEMDAVKSNFAEHEVFQKRKGERLEHFLHAAEKNEGKAIPITGRGGP